MIQGLAKRLQIARINKELSRKQTAELVARSFSPWFEAELCAYYSKGDNLIQTVDMHNENTGRFINKGIELSAQSSLRTNLSIYASYSYLHTSLSALTGAP